MLAFTRMPLHPEIGSIICTYTRTNSHLHTNLLQKIKSFFVCCYANTATVCWWWSFRFHLFPYIILLCLSLSLSRCQVGLQDFWHWFKEPMRYCAWARASTFLLDVARMHINFAYPLTTTHGFSSQNLYLNLRIFVQFLASFTAINNSACIWVYVQSRCDALHIHFNIYMAIHSHFSVSVLFSIFLNHPI